MRRSISALVDAGLATSSPVRRKPYCCPTFSIGAVEAGFDLTKANRLVGDLEDEAFEEKLRQGR